MIDYAARLNAALKHAEMDVTALAKALDITYQGVKRVVDGKSKAFSATNHERAAALLGVSSLWLATGEGAMKGDSDATNTVLPQGNVSTGPDLRSKVPLISWVRAREWCEASDPFQPSDAERWLDCPVSHSNGTFALRVRGDSMTAPSGAGRTYPEGCIIFVDPERLAPVNGDRVVACLEGSHEVTFKVYKNEDGRQWLMPLNPQHEPIREPFRVLGTVLGKWEDG
ncbi:MAG: S24 family peptidase [Acidovorax sp.]